MRIRELRKQLGLSQVQLAALLGIKQASVSLWERGRAFPTAKNIIKLTKIFNCSSDELLAG